MFSLGFRTRRRFLLATTATTAATVIAGLATAAHAATPIDTGQPFYDQSDVGTTVTPDFKGGTLRDNQNGVTDANDYTVENIAGNTIDAFGDATTFAGTFSGAGGLTITDSIGGGVVIVSGTSFLGGTVTIDSGATMQWGDGGPAFLVGASNSVVDNGALTMNFGGGGIAGAIPISGSGSVEIEAGSLNDSGVSTFTGPTTIDSAGLLLLTGAGSIADSSNVIANGIFDISGTTAGAAITTLSGSGGVSLGNQTLTLTAASGTFSGVLADGGLFGGTGGGALTIAGGTETLTGTNTFTGPTTVNLGATLQLGNGGTTGSLAGDVVDNGLVQFDYGGPVIAPNSFSGTGSAEVVAGTVVVTSTGFLGGTVTIDPGATMQWGDGGPAFLVGASNSVVDNGALTMNFGGGGIAGAIPISGTGSVEIEAGSLNDSGVSTYTGPTTIDLAGVLALTGAGSIADSSNVIANGIFDISGTSAGAAITTLAGSGGVSLGNQTLTLTAASGVFSGVLADGGLFGGIGGGALTIAGGTETLTGTNTFTGLTTVNLGATLQLGNGGTTGTLAGDVVDNGLVQFDYSSPVTAPNSFSGTGSAEVVAGTVVVTSTGFLGGTVTIDPGATMQWGDGGPAFLVGASNSVVDNGALTMNFGGGGIAGAIPISGSGSVEIESGSLNDSGVSTFTGPTTIDPAGVLALTGAGSIADSSNVIANGILDISGTTAGAAITTLAGSGGVSLGNQTLTLTAASGVFSGVLADGGLFGGTGGGALTIAGGTETLSGTNTFTGPTTIDLGATLQLGDGGSTGSVAGSVLDNGLVKFDYAGPVIAPNIFSGTGSAEVVAGTVVVTATSFLGGTVTIDPGATLQWGNGGPAFLVGGGNAVVDNGALTMNFGGGGIAGAIPISGSGSVEIEAGSLNDSGVSTYTGPTTIDPSGVLALSGAGSIANSSNVTVNGVFDISGTAAGASITTLAGAGGVSLGAQTLTLTKASGVFSGVLADGGLVAGTGGGLTIAGGTETLTGANTFTGLTTINGGATLQLGNGGTTGSVASNIVDNGLVKFDYGGAVTVPNALTGGGSAEVVAGTVVVTGISVLGGTVTIDNGATLQWGDGAPALLAGASVVDNGALVADFGAGGVSGAIPISGAGSVEIESGVLTEAGPGTYTGPTTIDLAGVLRLSGAGSIAASSDVTVNGVFDISGTAAGASITTLAGAGGVSLGDQTLTLTKAAGVFSGVLADGGHFGGTGGGLTVAGGSETLTGANTFTGPTTINGGATLQLGNGGTTGSVASNIVDNGTLVLDRSDVVTFSQSISGAGALNQDGAGTTILNAVNPLSGLTTISAGALEVGDAAHPGATLGGAVVVGAGGLLEGHGTIGGLVTNTAGGVVRPGGTIGTLTVGSYTQGGASTLAIEVTPTAASQLNVLGAASLGGTLALTFDAGTYGVHLYEIVAGHPVSGTFSTVSTTGSPGELFGIAYTPNQVDLVLEPKINAQIYGGVSAATIDQTQDFASLVEDRFGDAACVGVAPEKSTAACNGYGAWAFAIGPSNQQSADGAIFGFHNTGAGIIGGLDGSWGAGARVGVAFGYLDNDLGMGAAAAKATGSSYFASLYGRLVAGQAWFDGQLFYMHTDWSVSRTVSGVGVANAHPDVNSGGFLLQASTPIGAPDLRAYARFTFVTSDRQGVTEQGVGPLGFQIGSATHNSAIGEVGLQYAPTITSGGVVLRPTIQLGVQGNAGDHDQVVSGSLDGLPGTAFTQAAPHFAQVAGVVDAGLKVQVNPRFELFGDVRGRFASGETDVLGSLGGVLRF